MKETLIALIEMIEGGNRLLEHRKIENLIIEKKEKSWGKSLEYPK